MLIAHHSYLVIKADLRTSTWQNFLARALLAYFLLLYELESNKIAFFFSLYNSNWPSPKLVSINQIWLYYTKAE